MDYLEKISEYKSQILEKKAFIAALGALAKAVAPKLLNMGQKALVTKPGLKVLGSSLGKKVGAGAATGGLYGNATYDPASGESRMSKIMGGAISGGALGVGAHKGVNALARSTKIAEYKEEICIEKVAVLAGLVKKTLGASLGKKMVTGGAAGGLYGSFTHDPAQGDSEINSFIKGTLGGAALGAGAHLATKGIAKGLAAKGIKATKATKGVKAARKAPDTWGKALGVPTRKVEWGKALGAPVKKTEWGKALGAPVKKTKAPGAWGKAT